MFLEWPAYEIDHICIHICYWNEGTIFRWKAKKENIRPIYFTVLNWTLSLLLTSWYPIALLTTNWGDFHSQFTALPSQTFGNHLIKLSYNFCTQISLQTANSTRFTDGTFTHHVLPFIGIMISQSSPMPAINPFNEGVSSLFLYTIKRSKSLLVKYSLY